MPVILLQITVAAFLTLVYATLKCQVLGCGFLDMIENGPHTPAAAFLLYLATTFFLAACLHPCEMLDLMHLFTYLMLLSGMLMLLNIYAVINAHVILWGTREVSIGSSYND